jgi:hypothetical protein
MINAKGKPGNVKRQKIGWKGEKGEHLPDSSLQTATECTAAPASIKVSLLL